MKYLNANGGKYKIKVDDITYYYCNFFNWSITYGENKNRPRVFRWNKINEGRYKEYRILLSHFILGLGRTDKRSVLFKNCDMFDYQKENLIIKEKRIKKERIKKVTLALLYRKYGRKAVHKYYRPPYCTKEEMREQYKKYYYWNPEFRIRHNLRSLIRSALMRRGTVKSKRTEDLTGCSFEFLVKYIESKFKPGMSWGNRPLWHIDHIRPCASFNLRDEAEQRKCFHYSNLQPLWAEENLRKHDKYLP